MGEDNDGWVTLEFPPRVTCPTCGEQIPFGVEAKVEPGVMALRAELTEVWAHSFEHEQANG